MLTSKALLGIGQDGLLIRGSPDAVLKHLSLMSQKTIVGKVTLILFFSLERSRSTMSTVLGLFCKNRAHPLPFEEEREKKAKEKKREKKRIKKMA